MVVSSGWELVVGCPGGIVHVDGVGPEVVWAMSCRVGDTKKPLLQDEIASEITLMQLTGEPTWTALIARAATAVWQLHPDGPRPGWGDSDEWTAVAHLLHDWIAGINERAAIPDWMPLRSNGSTVSRSLDMKRRINAAVKHPESSLLLAVHPDHRIQAYLTETAVLDPAIEAWRRQHRRAA